MNDKRLSVKITDKHLTFTAYNDVKNACQHLFANSHISVFYHGIVAVGGKVSLLTTIPEYNQFVFANGLMPKFGGPELAHGTHYLPSSRGSLERFEMGKRFNIDNVIEFVEEKGDQVEVIGFGTACGKPEMTNYYFDHLAQLKQFAQQFKDNANELIQKSYKQPIIIPEGYKNTNKCTLPKTLTVREKDVLLALYRGLSAKQTACLFDISPRTVEYYLDCAKLKFGVRKKAELVKCMMLHNLI